MLDALREKIETTGAANVRTDGREPGAMADSGERFDLIISSMALHHVSDTAALLGTFFRLLDTGGMIALADLDAEEGDFHSDNTGVEHFGFSRPALERMCADTGFSAVEIHDAFRMPRTTAGGEEREYGIFLMTAVKMQR
jgi:2-polyprenyl-3-methyl-5-hydroxy-6-metoxy-1,4-benzoquinol methylase